MSTLFIIVCLKRNYSLKQKNMKKAEEMSLIKAGNMNSIERAVKQHAFCAPTQIMLLEPEYRPVLDLYLNLRKPCRDFVKVILTGKYTADIVKASVVGNTLSEENEVLLIQNFPNLVQEYLVNNPNGPYLTDAGYNVAIENEKLSSVVPKRPECKPATSSLGSLFSPEMLSKLGVA